MRGEEKSEGRKEAWMKLGRLEMRKMGNELKEENELMCCKTSQKKTPTEVT